MQSISRRRSPAFAIGAKPEGGSRAARLAGLLGWMALTFSAAVTGVLVKTGGWYAELAKPAWVPPNWVFAPAWTALYAMMGVAAWLVWLRGGWEVQGTALGLYLVQWALNALWTPLFFGLQRPGLALVEAVFLASGVLVTLIAFWRVRRVAGLLFVPYAFWVAFAVALNVALWRLNR